MKIAIYARCSTDEQTPSMQLRELREYCKARNYDITHTYIDTGVSGAKESRPQLNSLMNDARKRRFDAVLVWKFDRFARSSRHLVNALYEFKSLGIEFISFTENIDTSSPIGQAVFTIISAMAELERNLIRERVKAGVANARAKGKLLGRPKKRVNVSKVKELTAEGKSQRFIANILGVSQSTLSRSLNLR